MLNALIVCDLDDTVFDFRFAGEIRVLGGDYFWLELIRDAVTKTEKYGIKLYFAIVTHKSGIDAYVVQAGVLFNEFFNRQGGNMLDDGRIKISVMTSSAHQIYAVSLEHGNMQDALLISSWDNMVQDMIVSRSPKSIAIRHLMHKHSVLPSNVIVIDDSPIVSADIKMNHPGITVITPDFHRYEYPTLYRSERYERSDYESKKTDPVHIDAQCRVIKSGVNTWLTSLLGQDFSYEETREFWLRVTGVL